jgi:cell wall-active antibiotic response 4TMS protein YvqF
MNDQTNETETELQSVVVRPLGGLRRSGRLALRPSTTFVAVIGGVDLDLTDATLPPQGARLTKVSLVGGVSIVVPPDVRVELRGFSLVGGRNVERVRDTPADARVLRIDAWSLVGGVSVRVAA